MVLRNSPTGQGEVRKVKGMRFTTREDIEAPIDFVFGRLADFPAIERAAMRRGAEVQRIDRLPDKGPGMTWDAQFNLRGKPRELRLELTDFDPPNGLSMSSRSTNIDGVMVAELVALSRISTRLAMQFDLTPRNLSGKLFVQSLKLARKTVTGKVQARLSAFARDVGARFSGGI